MCFENGATVLLTFQISVSFSHLYRMLTSSGASARSLISSLSIGLVMARRVYSEITLLRISIAAPSEPILSSRLVVRNSVSL